MTTNLSYVCDECKTTGSWKESCHWTRIEIKPIHGYGANIYRELCQECWRRREENIIKAITEKHVSPL